MLTTLTAALLTGYTPSRPLGRRAAIGTAAAVSFLPVTAAFAADSEASVIAEIKEIREKLDVAKINKLLEEESWDQVRSIFKQPPVNLAWVRMLRASARSATARHPRLLRLLGRTRVWLGGALRSGGVLEPRRAGREAEAPTPASVPFNTGVEQGCARLHALIPPLPRRWHLAGGSSRWPRRTRSRNSPTSETTSSRRTLQP